MSKESRKIKPNPKNAQFGALELGAGDDRLRGLGPLLYLHLTEQLKLYFVNLLTKLCTDCKLFYLPLYFI